MNKVIWTLPALANIQAIRSYINTFTPRAARHVADSLITAGDNLAYFPHRGRPVPKTNSRELVAEYPYIIRYRVDGNTVVILRIRHTSRRPTNP